MSALRWAAVPVIAGALTGSVAVEAGTIGAASTIINGVVDALSGLGVHDVPMPASPHNVWTAINAARVNSNGGSQ